MTHYTNTSNPVDFPKTESMMNERIRELEKQSYIAFKDENSFECLVFSKEKFAELIIQKCIEEAGDPADGLILDDTWHDGVRASVWSIQQYFGVK